jgi:hypothetical protein
MLLARRTTAAACAVLAALALASCGVDAGDQAATATATETTAGGSTATTAPPSKDLSPAEQEAVDRVTELYVDLGMDPDDAQCLAEGLAGSMETLDPSDTEAMMDVVNQCDISMSELSQLGQDEGLDSMEDGLKFGLEASLEAEGLTSDQASCVADAFVDEFGSDVTAAQDPELMRPIFEDCGVDPALTPGN